jgi:hypothetical protein
VSLTYFSVAGAALAQSKPFKFGVTINGRTLYITEKNDASENIADGVQCVLNDDKIACGAAQGGFAFIKGHPGLSQGGMKPIASDKNNQGWSIGSDNVISWQPESPTLDFKVNFSTSALPAWMGGGGSPNAVSAETCTTLKHPDGPMFTPGVAKAYFIE